MFIYLYLYLCICYLKLNQNNIIHFWIFIYISKYEYNLIKKSPLYDWVSSNIIILDH